MTSEAAAASAAAEGMSERTRRGLLVAAAAAELGILGDALLRGTPWGMGAAVWTAAVVVSCLAMERWMAEGRAATRWLAAALLFGALLAWRDSPTLKALDITALLVLLGVAMMRWRGVEPAAAGVGRYLLSLCTSAVEAAFGAVRVPAADVRWSEVTGGRWARLAVAGARGAALAVPLLFVFGALLASADASFERMLGRVFGVAPSVVVGHLLLAGLIAWMAGGVLRTLAFGAESPDPAPSRPGWVVLGTVEAGIVLGLLDLLFLAFVAVQLPYFFGAPPAGGHAEYARRGFFELVWVAALALPLLLLADWVVRRRDRREVLAFRLLAGGMVALLFVIMASALHRMRLYQHAFGLTELRLYTTAFMLWLGVVLALFAATVLRGRRERFATGALCSGLATVVLLHAADPDGWIVRVNVARAGAGAAFDARYAATLSADAVPVLAAELGPGRHEDACAARALLDRWGTPHGDWRSWSLGRHRAAAAVRSRRAELEGVAERGCAGPRPVHGQAYSP